MDELLATTIAGDRIAMYRRDVTRLPMLSRCGCWAVKFVIHAADPAATYSRAGSDRDLKKYRRACKRGPDVSARRGEVSCHADTRRQENEHDGGLIQVKSERSGKSQFSRDFSPAAINVREHRRSPRVAGACQKSPRRLPVQGQRPCSSSAKSKRRTVEWPNTELQNEPGTSGCGSSEKCGSLAGLDWPMRKDRTPPVRSFWLSAV